MDQSHPTEPQGTDDALAKARQLLLQAQKLREQAKMEESQVHTEFMDKKRMQEEETDSTMRHLFVRNYDNDDTALVSPKITASRIQSKRLSLTCLEKIVDRLQYLEAEARGESHVILLQDKTFQKTSSHAIDTQTLQKIQQWRQLLLDAATSLDQEPPQPCRWTRGTLYSHLHERVQFMKREHETQFRKRQEEFFHAAQRKKHFHEAGGQGFSGLHSIYHGKEEDEDGEPQDKKK
jgi:hypothetical protein